MNTRAIPLILLGRDGAQRGEVAEPRIGEQHIDGAFVRADGREELIEILRLEISPWMPFAPAPIAFTAPSSSECLRPKCRRALSAAKRFAVPVVPPVMTAVLPSSLPIDTSI
jgi:hypothetical protein